ncbi:MAG: alpha/beta hydrolase-fold protein [Bacteroidota bacterium]
MFKTLLLFLLGLIIIAFLAINYTPLSFVYTYFLQSSNKMQGQIQLLQLDHIQYFLYLPPDYQETPDTPYPVIYHLHGAMPLPWGVAKSIIRTDVIASATLLEKLAEEGKAEPSIIVAPYDGMGTSMWSNSWTGEIMGESDLIDKLIPFIETTYPISRDRAKTTLQGFSMGGFGAIKIGFKYPEKFAKIISFDGAIHTWQTISSRRKGITAAIFQSEERFLLNSPWEQSQRYTEVKEKFPITLYVIEAWVKEYNRNFRTHLDSIGLDFTYIETDCQHDMGCMSSVEEVSIVYEL